MQGLPFPSHFVPLSRSSSASWTPVDAPEGTAARCNPVSKKVSGFGLMGRITGDKVDFYCWVPARVINRASSDLFDSHNGIESIDLGFKLLTMMKKDR